MVNEGKAGSDRAGRAGRTGSTGRAGRPQAQIDRPQADSLNFDLHKLTARLDRAADRILHEHEGISYSRFLTLFAVQNGAANQRGLAMWLGQSEPSTSRMVRVLTADGLLDARQIPGDGNARRLRLTPAGAVLVERGSALLEARFAQLLERSGVSRASYHRQTRRLLEQLEADTAGPDLTEAA
jgi:DNA-binding MarR family transcriptional regulator